MPVALPPIEPTSTRRSGLLGCALCIGVSAVAVACGGQSEETDFARDMAGAAPTAHQASTPSSEGMAAGQDGSGAIGADEEATSAGDGPGSTVDTTRTTFAAAPSGTPAPAQSASALIVSDDGDLGDEMQDEEPDSIVTLDVPASDLVADGGACQVWLDVADSELVLGDVRVSFDGEMWPAVDGCDDETLGWHLLSDADGTWLVLCPAACGVVGENLDGELSIEAEYWTKPAALAR